MCVAANCYALHWLGNMCFDLLNASTRPSCTKHAARCCCWGHRALRDMTNRFYGCIMSRRSHLHVACYIQGNLSSKRAGICPVPLQSFVLENGYCGMET
jgi:hypothetical protein